MAGEICYSKATVPREIGDALTDNRCKYWSVYQWVYPLGSSGSISVNQEKWSRNSNNL